MTELQKIRRERGLTQLELAARSGVSLRMVQHYERGEFNFQNVGVLVMLRLAVALQCKLSDLLSGAARTSALCYEGFLQVMSADEEYLEAPF